MKTLFRLITVALACALFLGLAQAAPPAATPTPTPIAPPVPPDLAALHDKLAATLSPAANAWIADEAAKAAKNTKTTESNIRADIQTRFTGQSLEGKDLNILLFVVLGDTTKVMSDDLNTMVGDLQKQAAQKQATDPVPGKAGTTSISLSPEDTLLLQTAIERRTKFIETMATVKKKLTDTQSYVVGNLK